MKTFEQRSVIPTTLEQVYAFHNDRRAIRWLTPPFVLIRFHRDSRSSLTDGELEMTLWFLALPVRWTARHEPGPTGTSFQDRMLVGPLGMWVHQHLFREVPGGVELVDHLTYEHRGGLWGIFTRLVFDGLPLRILFLYRHWQTRRIAPSYKTPTG